MLPTPLARQAVSHNGQFRPGSVSSNSCLRFGRVGRQLRRVVEPVIQRFSGSLFLLRMLPLSLLYPSPKNRLRSFLPVPNPTSPSTVPSPSTFTPLLDGTRLRQQIVHLPSPIAPGSTNNS